MKKEGPQNTQKNTEKIQEDYKKKVLFLLCLSVYSVGSKKKGESNERITSTC
jgi:hypothetical protein